ncbi:MAG: SIS domain-containing protein [Ignavibacteriae bacterium]|nr:SIS domain-containing protein [Ignavibacteriota bacterium]
MFRDLVETITAEIRLALHDVSDEQVGGLVGLILGARRIVVHGAGRVGLACRGFAMRLGHVGRSVFTVADSTIPPLGKGDILIVGSSSGETQTVYDVAVLGKRTGAHLVVITAKQDSRLGKLADVLILLNAPTKFGPTEGRTSIQPMASLFEQSLQIFFDALVLQLMKATNQTHADLWARHSNLD